MTDAAEIGVLLREKTTLTALPLTPEIKLHLGAQAIPLWEATEEHTGETGLPPPFWAFAWVGGQALAHHIIERSDAVLGKRVLDLASGSGIVAIAAKMAGASYVLANDVDPFAKAAVCANAAANNVEIDFRSDDMIGQDIGDFDVVLIGDFFYDRDLAERTTAWLPKLCKQGSCILIGDPGRSYLPKEQLTFVAAYDVPSSREIEDHETKRCTIYRWKG